MEETHLDEHLTNCFVSYFIHLKENENTLAYSKIYTSLFTALGGLDKSFHSSEFINKMKEDFQIIVQHLEKISHELYKEERRNRGLFDRQAQHEHTLSVNDTARKLNISPQAIRKAIKEGRLNASKNAQNEYTITEQDFDSFVKNRRRK